MNKKRILLLISNKLGLKIFNLLKKNKKFTIFCYSSNKNISKHFKFIKRDKKIFEAN